jgi:protoporphyrinogen oxidase
VIVLGAGLAGLRAALYLVEKGHDALVLEKIGEPGGMARSHERAGFVFDHGPHGFLSRDQWINEEFEEVVATQGGWYTLTKWSQIHYLNQYFNFPLKIQDILLKMSLPTLMATGFSFLWSRLRVLVNRRPPRNTEEYLVDQFGRKLYQVFFGPYTRKVWGVEPRELDADFARDRVPSLNLWDVIRKMFTDPAKEQFRVTPSGRVITHDLHSGYYPRRGAWALPRGYAARLLRSGGRIRYNVEVERIDRAAQVVTARAGNERLRLPYDRLINTIPMDVLVPLLDPPPPEDIRRLAASLRYRAILLVNLCIDKPKVIDPHWIYFTDRLFNRISEYKHFSPDLVPDGKTGICLELGANEADELWSADDGEIVRRCVVDLEDLGLVKLSEVLDYFVIREVNAYPLYDVGYKSRLERLVAWLEGEAGIMTAGRQGRFLYCNQDAAIKSGYEAAEAAHRLMTTGATYERQPLEDVRPRRKIVV